MPSPSTPHDSTTPPNTKGQPDRPRSVPSSPSSLLHLLPHTRNARADIARGVLLLLLTAALELLQPWPIKWLVDYVFGHAPPPHWLTTLCPWLTTPHIPTAILGVCLSVLALALSYRACQIAGQWFLIRAGGRLSLSLRAAVCDHLHHQSLSYHDRTNVTDSLYRAAYDPCAVQSLFSAALAPVATGLLTLAGILAVMFALDPLLALVALAMLPFFALMIRSFGRSIERHAATQQSHERTLSSRAQESFSAIRTVQAFGRERWATSRFSDEATSSFRATNRLTLTQLLFSGSIGLAMATGTAAVIGAGALRVTQHRLLVGDILVFLSYLGMLYAPVNAFAQSAGVIQSTKSQLARVFATLHTPTSPTISPDAKPLPHPTRGLLELHDVSFSYSPDRPALHHLSLTLPAGRTTAIVGRTGSGKSSLVSLLTRFYDPSAGHILLDGHDLRSLPLDFLRSQFSLVPQDPVLLAGTVAENIAFGRPDASRDDIITAAQRAQADPFIRALPDGYDTPLGERGVNLSGGQRQRLALARAFLRDAPVLILDEPTSAIDAHTEADLLDALADLTRDRTTIVIAHRLSTIRSADQILLLDDGRLLEQGTHASLLAADGPYADLHRRQWDPTNEPTALEETP